MLIQLVIGFLSGVLVGVAIFSNPFSRAVVTGLVAGIVIGDIMIDGVEGYINWATFPPRWPSLPASGSACSPGSSAAPGCGGR
jgi:hypothetical protein